MTSWGPQHQSDACSGPMQRASSLTRERCVCAWYCCAEAAHRQPLQSRARLATEWPKPEFCSVSPCSAHATKLLCGGGGRLQFATRWHAHRPTPSDPGFHAPSLRLFFSQPAPLQRTGHRLVATRLLASYGRPCDCLDVQRASPVQWKHCERLPNTANPARLGADSSRARMG